MKRIKEFFEWTNVKIRPVTVFLVILACVIPTKGIAVMIYGWVCNLMHPATMWEDVFALGVSGAAGVAVGLIFMDMIYDTMKKHFKTV